MLQAARRSLDERRRRDPDGDDAEEGLSANRRTDYRMLRLTLIDAQWRELLRLRDLGTYSSASLESALTELDAEQYAVQLRASNSQGT